MIANPYRNASFFDFFLQFATRLWLFVTGQIPLNELASDEIQIIVLMGVSASAALIGSFLVLRKMTMLANSLSHTILLGIVLAFVFTPYNLLEDGQQQINIQIMLLAALFIGFLTAFLTEFLHKVAKLQEDASTGLVFTSLFALGIILATLLTRNSHIGTEVIMGNVDALHLDDCKLVLIILGLNVASVLLFFKEFKITTFDSGLARSLGISPTWFNYLLMAQVSITTLAAFRAVGVLMLLAFITGPVLTARMLTHHLNRLILLSIGIGCLASLVGVALSRHLLSTYDLALSTGGLVVCIITLFFWITLAITHFKKSVPLKA
ncbi:MAG: metal ABC transporter permease [Parachlamydiaceae bacterium]|nr:metal ABC transporter permease [Parachlamydiaceae bacterium]